VVEADKKKWLVDRIFIYEVGTGELVVAYGLK
jgi:hypothetical protein